jgi:DNA-binding GntR family transcriptional regulator
MDRPRGRLRSASERSSAAESPPAKGASSSDLVFRQILQGLYEGRFVPGQRLVEADLTRSFKVSRGSVREALSRLAAEGVVALSLNRGAQVRALTRGEVRDLLAVIEMLVGLAARFAAERIGEPGNRGLLQASLDRLLRFADSPDFFRFVQARNAFYRTLLQIGGNRELARLLPSMHVHLVRIQFRAYHTEADDKRFDDYRQIVEAVLTGPPARAELAGRRHIRRIQRSLGRLPAQAFAPED